jgi:hypothetical protein
MSIHMSYILIMGRGAFISWDCAGVVQRSLQTGAFSRSLLGSLWCFMIRLNLIHGSKDITCIMKQDERYLIKHIDNNLESYLWGIIAQLFFRR